MRNFFFLIFFLLIFQLATVAQVQRETRAVWLTTNFASDWPPNTYDIQIQKDSLREIFRSLKSKHFNTVYFQVRSNGTSMYRSFIEPFSPYITGTVGDDLPYDPLQFAIDLGKEFHLEVHAWVNMVRCFTGSNESILSHPDHVRSKHPEWTVRRMRDDGKLSYWLNPGLFEVQEHLTRILLEISNNYDIDGIHLDFFRYPDKSFKDREIYNQFSNNLTLDDWRRNNLTEILRSFKKRVKPKNPYLKVGATPIGIRKSLKGAIGWEGYSSVYQDTEKWLQEGLVDYLTPQIYWPFEDNPRFDVLADDWVKKAYGKNIVLGLAAYKPDVKIELDEMVNYSRKISAAGISFFRYKHIAQVEDSYFSKLAFPKEMSWKVNNKIDTHYNFECNTKDISTNEVLLSWRDLDNNDLRYYALNSFTNDSTYSTKLISPKKNKIKLKFGKPKKLQYKYSIGKLDRLWNESNMCNQFAVNVPYLKSLKKSANISTKPMLVELSDSNSFLSLFSSFDQDIVLEIITKENLITQRKVNLSFGQNILK
ncbi:MAG: family 10 glycosylhydrolase, partial [Ignavibacteriae bacterium]|nr:family 10 glycosylhydrolase [Ignavibacteriota bacterium]